MLGPARERLPRGKQCPGRRIKAGIRDIGVEVGVARGHGQRTGRSESQARFEAVRRGGRDVVIVRSARRHSGIVVDHVEESLIENRYRRRHPSRREPLLDPDLPAAGMFRLQVRIADGKPARVVLEETGLAESVAGGDPEPCAPRQAIDCAQSNGRVRPEPLVVVHPRADGQRKPLVQVGDGLYVVARVAAAHVYLAARVVQAALGLELDRRPSRQDRRPAEAQIRAEVRAGPAGMVQVLEIESKRIGNGIGPVVEAGVCLVERQQEPGLEPWREVVSHVDAHCGAAAVAELVVVDRVSRAIGRKVKRVVVVVDR